MLHKRSRDQHQSKYLFMVLSVCLFVCFDDFDVPVQHMQAKQGQTEAC